MHWATCERPSPRAVQASIAANTYVISGHAESKSKPNPNLTALILSLRNHTESKSDPHPNPNTLESESVPRHCTRLHTLPPRQRIRGNGGCCGMSAG